uniref:Cilia and flagella associated protein 210 n=1 Tax=Erpetoichthys calabaricus TaxID=27687 RepID=A0A8C4SDE1_ERPCA
NSTQMLTQQHVPVDFHDLQQVTILPKAEWQRIQENINKVNSEAEWLQQVRREKESLHERSKEVVKNWSNTIAGQRQKKLEEKRIWEEQEEEERRKIDLEEAQLKAANRKEAIEQAKKLQYFQTDRVKGFHSALLLSEVIKERDAQVELKQKKLNAMKNIDSDVLGRMQREREEAIYEDQQKALKRFLDQKATSEEQMEQEKQEQRNQMTDLLAAQIQEKQFNDDEIIAKAVAEQEEKFGKEVKEKEAKRTEELKLISEHRYRTVFLKIISHAEKQEQSRRQRVQQLEYDKQSAALNIAEEKQFQEYANEVIEASKRAERNVYALRKAARGGIGGGLGPVVGGLRPSYLTQDNVGVQLPNYNRTSTQDIKLLNDTGSIQQSKKRLGFTW